MPESPESDLKAIETKATELITKFGGRVGKVDIEPIAFGLKAVKLMFSMDEKIGSTESLEQEIAAFDDVNSCEATDCRRAIG